MDLPVDNHRIDRTADIVDRGIAYDLDNPGIALDRSGHPNPVPRVVGKISRRHAVGVRDVEFLRRHTRRRVKVTVPGPFTMSQQAQNDYYRDDKALALDIAAAVNEEIRSLQAAGADVVQIEPPGGSPTGQPTGAVVFLAPLRTVS